MKRIGIFLAVGLLLLGCAKSHTAAQVTTPPPPPQAPDEVPAPPIEESTPTAEEPAPQKENQTPISASPSPLHQSQIPVDKHIEVPVTHDVPEVTDADRESKTVWVATNKWNDKVEKQFSQWVATDWTEDIFAAQVRNGKPNPYYGIPTDCADAAYAMRIIYSYQHHLPFKMYNPERNKTGQPKYITNDMTNWSNLSAEKRIVAFIRYVGDVGSTQSLPDDTYPVAVSREGIRPGGISLRLVPIGHAREIMKLDEYGNIELMNSTEPKAVRYLYRTITWKETPQVPARDGYRYWIPYDYYGKPVKTIPGYSLEQYKFNFESSNATAKFKLVDEPIPHIVHRYLKELCSQIQVRADGVRLGGIYQKQIHGRCMNSSEWEGYSSDWRDDYIKSVFDYINTLTSNLNGDYSGISEDEKTTLIDIARGTVTPGVSLCDVRISKDQTMNPQQMNLLVKSGNWSVNPNEPLEVRWGQAESKNPNRCHTY